MNLYQRHVVPRLTHLVPYRRHVIGAAEGRVLEVGVGSGLNLPLYGPSARSIIALEPSSELLRMARHSIGTRDVPRSVGRGGPAGQWERRYRCDDLDALLHPRRVARIGRATPRSEAKRRAPVRRAWACAGARRRALAGSARSSMVTAGRRLPSQPQDG
jgi:hypothetical protein